MNTPTNITQEEIRALSNSIGYAADRLRENRTGSHADVYLESELDLAHKAVARMAHDIYKQWAELPDHTTLKEMYRDDVWHPESTPTNDHDAETRSR